MARMTVALAAALLAFCSTASTSPVTPKPGAVDITDKYIVSLWEDVDLESHLAHVQTLHADSLTKRSDGKSFEGVLSNYSIGEFRAYAGHFDDAVAKQLQAHKDVALLEKDSYITAAVISAPVPKVCGVEFNKPDDFDHEGPEHDSHANDLFGPMTTENWPPYGLRLISHRGGSKRTQGTGYYYDKTSGKGTWAYILDSGIYTRHNEFDKRAHKGYNAVRGIPNFDTDGHGTHVAGTIGGSTYGVAKHAQLVGVKVLHDNTGSASQLLDGLNWAVGEISDAKREARSVINLSLSGVGDSAAVKQAIAAAAEKGITTVVAAGNMDDDAGKAGGLADAKALVVAATNKDRSRAAFSNWGPAVSLFAPGVGTMSAWVGCPTARHRLSGTSMAAAHVAGLVSYFQSLRHIGRMDEVLAETPGVPGVPGVPGAPPGAGDNSTLAEVITAATKRAVSDPRSAPNLFAYNGSGR